MKTVNIGIIGLGQRCETLLSSIFTMKDEVRVAGICDLRKERSQKILEIFDKHGIKRPDVKTDYKELLKDPQIEAVLVPSSWNSHLRIAHDALCASKYVGIEVGGASSLDELWQLVHAAESTGASCMMLENCCYGRNELMVLNMVRQGLFGELVYCECGYEHDITDSHLNPEATFERTLHNQYRNGDLYPTHGLGPIAKILRINRGNRFLTITSTACKARGFAAARKRTYSDALPMEFNCGDVITSVIRCSNGETITMTRSISLPRPYSRNCRVQGANGIWLENAKGIYIEGISPKYEKLDVAGNPYMVHEWNTEDEFYDKYDHPIWQDFKNNIIGGHGGMDALALKAFFDSVRRKAVPPIDVYDVAAWMSATCLSEQSISLGSMPVAFPDFTNGKWIDRIPEEESKWALDNVFN